MDRVAASIEGRGALHPGVGSESSASAFNTPQPVPEGLRGMVLFRCADLRG